MYGLSHAVDMHLGTPLLPYYTKKDGTDLGILGQHGCKKMGWSVIVEALNQFTLLPMSILDM
jgi:hypothetical protein